MIYLFIIAFTILLSMIIQGIFGDLISGFAEILHEKARKLEIENDILEDKRTYGEEHDE
jgi:hypothetical protein